jgi:hypothetical protein
LPPDKRSAFFSGPCMASLQHCRKGAKVRLEMSCDGKILAYFAHVIDDCAREIDLGIMDLS